MRDFKSGLKYFLYYSQLLSVSACFNFHPKAYEDGKLDYFIVVEIPDDEMGKMLIKCPSNRDIYLYRDDLDLSKYQWTSGANYEWQKILTAALQIGGALYGALTGARGIPQLQ